MASDEWPFAKTLRVNEWRKKRHAALPLATAETQNWYLSLGEELSGPLNWAQVAERVRATSDEEPARTVGPILV